MTDIVEQAARKVMGALDCEIGEYDGPLGGGAGCFEHETDINDEGICIFAHVVTQALADAGLLAEPARTVPTREEIADRLHKTFLGVTTDDSSRKEIAEHVLELIANQPTVDGARPWGHEGHKPVQHRDGKPPWCRECGYTSPAPAIPARQIRDGE